MKTLSPRSATGKSSVGRLVVSPDLGVFGLTALPELQSCPVALATNIAARFQPNTTSLASIDAPFRNVMTSWDAPPLKSICQCVASFRVKLAPAP